MKIVVIFSVRTEILSLRFVFFFVAFLLLVLIGVWLLFVFFTCSPDDLALYRYLFHTWCIFTTLLFVHHSLRTEICYMFSLIST